MLTTVCTIFGPQCLLAHPLRALFMHVFAGDSCRLDVLLSGFEILYPLQLAPSHSLSFSISLLLPSFNSGPQSQARYDFILVVVILWGAMHFFSPTVWSKESERGADIKKSEFV